MLTTGYADAATSGEAIRENLLRCYGQISAYTQATVATTTVAAPNASGAVAATDPEIAAAPIAHQAAPIEAETEKGLDLPAATIPSVTLPWFGRINVQALSLPLLTVVIAGLDAFNPCAFFVLMFLLSLMVHGGSRRRMLLIGGVFVFFSGLLYFVFMAAWLNLFLLLGALRWITVVAGIVAVFFALINIKDYFWFKQGVSLSIPARAKPQLYQRTRQLLRAERLPTVLLGTTLLALAANAYELLCTSGFPMIYTRTLTLNALTPAAYYLYLALYNLIYVIPLLVIVVIFAVKFGSRKLKEEEGRTLKLLSGLMMLLLGVLLIVAPERLGQVWIAVTLLVAALGLTALIIFAQRMWPHKPTHAAGKR
jgi:MFS family permease